MPLGVRRRRCLIITVELIINDQAIHTEAPYSMMVLCVGTWDGEKVASLLVAMPKSVHLAQHSVAVFPRVFHCQGQRVDSKMVE